MVYIGLTIFIVIVVMIVSTISSNKKLKAYLEASFGKEPNDRDYSIDSIDTYYHYMGIKSDSSKWIDATTWGDLDMDKVFKRINVCRTSVGEEYLYHILHTQSFDTNEISKREELIAYLKSNPAQRLKLQLILSKLGKKDYNGMAALMSNKELKQLKFPYLYTVLATIPLIGIAMIPFAKGLGIGLLVTFLIVNTFVHFSVKMKIDLSMETLKYFATMLWCCKKISRIKDDRLKLLVADLENNYKVFKPISGRFPETSTRGLTDFEILAEYIKILILDNLRSYNKVIKCISKNLDCFKRLYVNFGELDASISILSFRESLPFYCIPEFHDDNRITAQKLYHPLLAEPVANDADIRNNCIITGSNASGKSTFIKAVAINGILAQTINTCAANSYSAKLALVMTSMAVRDSISTGDSYFIAEIKSLKRILDKISEMYCVCFVDEILRGTNTIERIAASASVLKYLEKKDCLCMVASHDIELTEILKNEYDNYHFSEQITDDGIHFDYLIKQGASQSRTAIKLLHYMNFDNDIVENAEGLVEEFLATQKWQSE